MPLKETNFIGLSDTRASTRGLASISMHTHSYITRAVATMDSCFTLIRVHQHDIAVRPLYGQSRFQRSFKSQGFASAEFKRTFTLKRVIEGQLS